MLVVHSFVINRSGNEAQGPEARDGLLRYTEIKQMKEKKTKTNIQMSIVSKS